MAARMFCLASSTVLPRAAAPGRRVRGLPALRGDGVADALDIYQILGHGVTSLNRG